LHYEALALHSFTDLFAFGHLMENRHLTMKIVKWAEGSVLRSLAKLIGKAASLVLGVLPYERRACADPQTAVQRQVIVEATAASIADVLRVAAGGTLEAGKELAALRYLPVHFRRTAAPIPPQDQKLNLLRLADKQGSSLLSRGFDFALGILKYAGKELQGSVSYLAALKDLCREGCR